MQVEIYEIMHMERIVASISTSGTVQIFQEQFMPYDFFLEEVEDIDIDTKTLLVLIVQTHTFIHAYST